MDVNTMPATFCDILASVCKCSSSSVCSGQPYPFACSCRLNKTHHATQPLRPAAIVGIQDPSSVNHLLQLLLEIADCTCSGTVTEVDNSWSGGGCALCASPDFERDEFGPNTVLICDQCEREYHVGCLKDAGMADLQALPEGGSPAAVRLRKAKAYMHPILLQKCVVCMTCHVRKCEETW